MDTPLPEPRLLLGPGPSPVPSAVLTALSRPPVGYLDPELFTLLARLQDGLRYVFQTANPWTIALTGTGMAGMEFCLVNLLEPGETAVIAVNGFFGGRMAEIATRLGAKVVRVDFPWGQPIDAARVDAACRDAGGKITLVGGVHAETSTGVHSDMTALSHVAQAHDALFLMDCVTSLGGVPVEIDTWRVDAAYSATQKCVGAPPGLAPVTLSARAWAKITARTTPVPNWFLDARLLDAYWHTRPAAYHHTVPVNLYYALEAALSLIRDETLPARFDRHARNAALLWRDLPGVAPDPLTPFAAPGHRLPTLNAVTLPPALAGAQEADLRARLLRDDGIEIGGGLGDLKGKVWRIGLMGHGSQARNVHALVGALRDLLSA